MKIPEPMMPPMTISAASRVPRRRSSLGEDWPHACISDVLPHDARQYCGAAAAARPPPAQAPAATMPQPLQNGACLDSLRAVPKVVQSPVSRAMQIVRIDQVVSTATMIPGEIIGFLYTTQDGSTWLGQRTSDYQSAADATAINRVLAATHVPGNNVTGFPPDERLRRADQISADLPGPGPARRARAAADSMAPCVVWPSDRPLPDPAM